MPDTRSHRGPHPQDAELFAPAAVPRLRAATGDVSWLLSRGYAMNGALQLVGNRYALEHRQRQAVSRSACTDEARAGRLARQVAPEALAGATVLVDGYNVLTTVEAALGGAVVLHARDGTYRDIAGVHGTWRHVEETLGALGHVGDILSRSLGVARAVWYVDAPVSNSGRLKTVIETVAREHGWAWDVRLVPDPDPELATTCRPDAVIATADSVILDAATRWFPLAKAVTAAKVPAARVVDLFV